MQLKRSSPLVAKIIFVELICAEAELEARRIEDASRKKFGKLASVEQYRSLKDSGAFQFPKLPTGISLDTTNQSPADRAPISQHTPHSISRLRSSQFQAPQNSRSSERKL